MITFKPKQPDTICLITTFRCNASCENCCFGCRPDRGATMTLAQMKKYIDKSLRAYPKSIRRLALTGGECMLLGNDIEKIVRYASNKGLSVDFISNGFWGRSYKQAYDIIIRLKNAGLTNIGFSTGEDHQKGVPLKNCRNAAVAAARLGFNPEFRVESHWGSIKCKPKLDRDTAFIRLLQKKKIDLQWWEWQRYNNEMKTSKGYPWRLRPNNEDSPCRHLFHEIIVTPYGDAIACCGIGALRNPYMRLGNINHDPVQKVYERAFQDALKIWIHTCGAVAVLRYVYEHSNIRFYDVDNGGCRACIEIFSNPKILPFLKERFFDWSFNIAYYPFL